VKNEGTKKHVAS